MQFFIIYNNKLHFWEEDDMLMYEEIDILSTTEDNYLQSCSIESY